MSGNNDFRTAVPLQQFTGKPALDDCIAWGKLRRSVSGVLEGWHPLLDHMSDVAACFLALAECKAIRRALHMTAGRELSAADLQRLAVLVFLHDIGKANAGFQSRRWLPPARPPPSWPTQPFGHGPEGWALASGCVDNAESIGAGLPFYEMATWGADVAGLLQASISHHGRPVSEDPAKQSSLIWQPVHSAQGNLLYDPAVTIAKMGERIRQSYPLAFTPGPHTLPDAPAFTHLFAGLVQLADWLGSDTRDGFFPYTELGEDRAQSAMQRATKAVRAIGLDVAPLRAFLDAQAPTFASAFGLAAPRPMQSAAADLSLGTVVILEAETGSGKTEAALWRFTQLFQAGEVDGLYFALPTRVAATQLYTRLREFVKRLWPQDAPVVVRALPGYEAADDHLRISLPDFKVQWPDNPSDEVAHRRWAAESHKRFLAATIAVGTIDQALLAALKVRHAHLRHAMLSRSLLVVDEVHASDAYMNVLLEQLLKAHLKTGGHALLLSATLGASASTRFLNIGRTGMPVSCPPLAQACARAYPAISSRSIAGMKMQAVEGNPEHKAVHWKTLDAMGDPVRVAALAVDAAAAGARVLVVRNTVPAAVATLSAVEALTSERAGDWLFEVHGVSTLHHSRFSRQDRPLLDKAVEEQLGKQRTGNAGRIVIGTQTLEQSLDIDADLLITDLCPMDVLLQRVGRLHRHTRPAQARPTAFRVAQAWVLTPPGDDLGPLLKRTQFGLGPIRDKRGIVGGVYPDLRVVELTRRLVAEQDMRRIPDANRVLVEQATHPDALQALEQELGEEWQKLGQAIDGSAGAQRSLGHLHTLPYGLAFAHQDVQFPEAGEKLATRLGAADRLLVFEPPQPGPFQQQVKDLALRHHQLPEGLSPDAMPVEIAALTGEGGFEFSLAGTRYRYSRIGLARLRRSDHGRGGTE
jgi:CRISPR-associated endonuclease/helicase Cas3